MMQFPCLPRRRLRSLGFVLLWVSSPSFALPTAELLHFTADARAASPLLAPDFLHHSSWSGLGAAQDGRIYIAVSNHQQPGGNAAVFRYAPGSHTMELLGDLESVSSAVGNWMPQESQYKVHTFLTQHADGYIYFASDDHDPTPFLRGAHIYRIDPATGQIEDFSKTQPFLMKEDLSVIANTMEAAEQSGVFIETYGIKGLSLHPANPDWFYAMTYPDGYLIRYRLSDAFMEVIGQSSHAGYVFYVDRDGDVYYSSEVVVGDVTSQTLYKWEAATGLTHTIAADLASGEVGAIAPSATGEDVYLLIATSKEIYRLRPGDDTLQLLTSACGSNWWRLYNLTLSPDEDSLYYVSNNNSRATVRKIDLDTLACTEILDVESLLGTRDLAFGGVGVWDELGAFYVPVWTFGADPPDVALLRVDVGELPVSRALPALAPAMLGTLAVLLALLAFRRALRCDGQPGRSRTRESARSAGSPPR